MNDVAPRSAQLTRLRRLLSSVAISISLSITAVVPAVAQQFPEVPLYELLPSNYPCPTRDAGNADAVPGAMARQGAYL